MIDPSFYQKSDVVSIARALLGMVLVTRINNLITSGRIVETEAYSYKERGCHAYQGKMTARNEVMFGEGGHAYVYLCYGIHQMFNVVTNVKGKADAVLVRALEPLEGMEHMQERTGVSGIHRITSGPGKLTRAMGIGREHNGVSLWSKSISIEPGEKPSRRLIVASRRIGIDYAGNDAKLPWRFTLKGNVWVSK